MPALASRSCVDVHDIHADVWHAHALSHAALPVIATGDATLDAQLPGGGWPIGALIEIGQPPGVHSEWRLLLPALAQSGHGPVVLVGAPHLPFAPALAAQGLAAQRLLWVRTPVAAARLWACEQALRCADVNAVLAWLPQARSDQLRRLQMAATEYRKLLFVMRPAQSQADASPAALRLQLQPQTATQHTDAADIADGLELQLLKRRGPPLDQSVYLQARAGPMKLLLAAAHALDCSTARA